MISEITKRLLIASKVKGVGRRTLHNLARERLIFELPIDSWHVDIPELKDMTPGSALYKKVMSEAEQDIMKSEHYGDNIISRWDACFPDLMRHTPDCPTILYIRGNIENFSDQAVAIIGTREPTEHGRITAERITKHFSLSSWQVVSGLALGIDTVAHQTTVSNGGSTVAVLAQGLDSIYPKENKELASKIVENNGLLVSEYGYNTRPFSGNFVERDRLQAALARGVIMVQSGKTGGSWHASRSSLQYNRFLFVPEPTPKDLVSGHPKTLGNIIMSKGSSIEKRNILKCDEDRLRNLVILKSRLDYPNAENMMRGIKT